MQLIYSTKMWLKKSESPLAKSAMAMVNKVRFFEVPHISIIHKSLYWLHVTVTNTLANSARILYWTPLFKSRLAQCGKQFYLYSGMPMVLGKLTITIGDHTRVSGISTFCGRSCSDITPELVIGSNVDIGWQNSINVGQKIIIGDNVRLAGKVFLAGFPGHPVDAKKRAQGLPEEDEQTGNIILENDVWLATGVTVLAGVTIGEGTIVGAGSIVTHDLPGGVIAAGSPAKVIKTIGESHE